MMGARLASLPAFGRSLKAAALSALHGATGLLLVKIPSPASGVAAQAIVSRIVVNATNIPISRSCLVFRLYHNAFHERNNPWVTRMIAALSACT
jgi:hypothetical protein